MFKKTVMLMALIVFGVFVTICAAQPPATPATKATKATKAIVKTEAVKAAVETLKPVIVKPDPMAVIDALLDAKGLDNFRKAIAACESILKSDPNNFEAAWRCAKSYREYGEEAKKREVRGWKDICAKYGKKGMQYAQKAIRLRPDKVNGYFFYGASVGIYADGKGIITALREGLKDKTQSNLEKAYKMDKDFEKGGTIVALGRFWQVVPFPFSDKDKAMKLYREFQRTKYYADSIEGHIYLAELLSDTGSSMWGGNKNAREVKRLVSQVNRLTRDPYWRNWGKRILNDL
ncbi:MAG: hypothetical protein GXP53_04190 [Deltaproteobacteria bacterium]|nr:hypothetical protein [Deltaproteobacteria bacterium]